MERDLMTEMAHMKVMYCEHVMRDSARELA